VSKPKLKLVSSRLNQDLLAIYREGFGGKTPTYTAFEKRFGVSEYKQRKFYVPHIGTKDDTQANQEPTRGPSKKVTLPKLDLQRVSTVPIILAGLALGGVGMYFNVQYWYTFGGISFGVLGGAIDLATIFLPASLAWRWCHIPYFALWLLCCGLSNVAAMGFSAANIGDSLQGRGVALQRRTDLETELATAKIERWKITENRDPTVIEQQIQVAQAYVPRNEWNRSIQCTSVTISISCLDVVRLREAKANAVRRGDLDTKIHDLSERISALPPVASKDPGADHIAKLTLGLFSTSDVENFRVVGFAFMPSFAGFLLARGLLR
jgi:hypothetical protein